jgi:hypothetical protein
MLPVIKGSNRLRRCCDARFAILYSGGARDALNTSQAREEHLVCNAPQPAHVLQPQKSQIMNSNIGLLLSSLLLAVVISSCSSGGSTAASGGDTGPVTTGPLTASFSNPTGTPTIGLTAFSATAGANKTTSVNATVIAGKQVNRLLTLQFSPILTGNRTCALTSECGIALVENGAGSAHLFINTPKARVHLKR